MQLQQTNTESKPISTLTVRKKSPHKSSYLLRIVAFYSVFHGEGSKFFQKYPEYSRGI